MTASTKPRGRAIMVQGTASHVGKSVLVAGLCRLFRQEGVRVAPFKAQNMALNSFATPEGAEIGRAQAVQAEAAGIPPSVLMNPILLKPEGNARSQVIVAGRVYRSMDAADYHDATADLWPVVESSLRQLLATFDLVIIEGAGSPAEVNLSHSDIVNMRVARAADAPVVLVADIDRGGVFASLVGTMELLESEDRARVAALIVNKFRGDPSLFAPGIAFLEERLRRPVLGIVPWIEGIGLAEEDSLGLPSPNEPQFVGARPAVPARPDEVSFGQSSAQRLDVVVLRFPHIANFDDFDLLRDHPTVSLRYESAAGALGRPDLIILPGTKTTRSDLVFLRRVGLDRAIEAHARAGGALLGICGGFQMLGQRIDDPDGVEGPAGSFDGMGLLPCITRFQSEKATLQVQGRLCSSTGLLAPAAGSPFSAYEIHMGQTQGAGPPVAEVHGSGAPVRLEGATSADGWVVGTYLHGLLRNPAVVRGLVASLAARRGLEPAPWALPEDPYDRLADILRACLDLPQLRRLAAI